MLTINALVSLLHDINSKMLLAEDINISYKESYKLFIKQSILHTDYEEPFVNEQYNHIHNAFVLYIKITCKENEMNEMNLEKILRKFDVNDIISILHIYKFLSSCIPDNYPFKNLNESLCEQCPEFKNNDECYNHLIYCSPSDKKLLCHANKFCELDELDEHHKRYEICHKIYGSIIYDDDIYQFFIDLFDTI